MSTRLPFPSFRSGGPALSSLLAGALLLVAGSAAHAVLLIGNSPGSGGNGDNDIFSTQWNAAEMTTSSTTYRLDEVVLEARKGSNSTQGIVVEIYDDKGAGGTAGNSLITLSTTDVITTSFATMTFTSAGSFIFQANSTYWIVAKGTETGASGLNTKVRTNANAYSGDAAIVAATDKTQYFCEDAPNNCLQSPPVWTLSPGSPGGSDEMAYSVSGTEAPEPASLALLGLGLAGIGFARRRR